MAALFTCDKVTSQYIMWIMYQSIREMWVTLFPFHIFVSKLNERQYKLNVKKKRHLAVSLSVCQSVRHFTSHIIVLLALSPALPLSLSPFLTVCLSLTFFYMSLSRSNSASLLHPSPVYHIPLYFPLHPLSQTLSSSSSFLFRFTFIASSTCHCLYPDENNRQRNLPAGI